MNQTAPGDRRQPAARKKAVRWLAGLLALIAAVVIVVAMRPTSQASSLKEARMALDGAATVSVIGDSTGNGIDEWVTGWASRLGRENRVEVHQWVDADNAYLDSPLIFGEDGDRLAIWNAAKSGGAANWAERKLVVVQPERPDLVVFNLGHNNTGDNIGGQLDTMRALTAERWGAVPLVVILQNPGRGKHADVQAATIRVVRTWALTNVVPTIDVNSAFNQPDKLMVDDAHPNAAGSKLWADTVADALE